MPPPEPVEATDGWLQRRFAEYYRAHPPIIPDRFARREYGFLFFGQKSMLRHVAFAKRNDFEAFHGRNGPAHSYYSTAFYQEPDAPTMVEKGWMGAELIFDLDADHVPGSEKLPYPEQLKRVKEHFVRLVDEFVRRDFGFEEKDLLLTFSGGRGYHCHVLAEKALSLSSQERREIVDFVTGTGLDLNRFIRLDPKTKTKGSYTTTVPSIKVSAAGDPGWGGRLNQALLEYLHYLKGLPKEQLILEFQETKGIGEKRLEKLAEFLTKFNDRSEAQVKQGYANLSDIMRELVPKVIAHQLIPLAKGETDEPVTSDTKRLIRTPGTLHGKSGFRVVPLRRDELEAFDPLVDAIAFSDEPVEIEVTKTGKTGLHGQLFSFEPGRMRVPEYAAVFAIIRGWARPTPSSA